MQAVAENVEDMCNVARCLLYTFRLYGIGELFCLLCFYFVYTLFLFFFPFQLSQDSEEDTLEDAEDWWRCESPWWGCCLALEASNFDFTVFTVFTLARVPKSLGFWAASQLSMKAMAAGFDKKIKEMAILPVDVACLGSFCAFVLDSVLTSWLSIAANLLDYFKHV